eukprot:11132780-Alexandrium_andersonii.AAC.1
MPAAQHGDRGGRRPSGEATRWGACEAESGDHVSCARRLFFPFEAMPKVPAGHRHGGAGKCQGG